MENSNQISQAELAANKERVVTIFRNFGFEIKTIEVTAGPMISLYEIVLKAGDSISKVRNFMTSC